MKVSVVIPTYNRPGLAENLNKQIKKYYHKAEVIIIDQTGSNHPNTSLAKNEGIKKSTGDIIIFFDDDVEITPQTIPSHLAEYKDHRVYGVAGRVINDGEEIPSNTNVVTGQVNVYATDFTKNFWGTKKQTIIHPYGCNMSFRKSILEKIGGFDTKFPPPLSSFEEVDLGMRVSETGRMVFSPEALVYHHRAKSGGTRTDIKQRNKLYYQSYGRLIKKHVPFPAILITILVLTVRIFKEAPYSLAYFFCGLFK